MTDRARGDRHAASDDAPPAEPHDAPHDARTVAEPDLAPGAAPLPDVQALLPHRFPLLLLDAITGVDAGRRATGRKRVTGGEWSAAAPGGLGAAGAMPHTLVIEALAQLTGALLVDLVEGARGAVGYFVGFDRVRCRGTVRPGDDLALAVTLVSFRRGICRTRGTAHVDGTLVVRADLTTVVRPAAAAPR